MLLTRFRWPTLGAIWRWLSPLVVALSNRLLLNMQSARVVFATFALAVGRVTKLAGGAGDAAAHVFGVEAPVYTKAHTGAVGYAAFAVFAGAIDPIPT